MGMLRALLGQERFGDVRGGGARWGHIFIVDVWVHEGGFRGMHRRRCGDGGVGFGGLFSLFACVMRVEDRVRFC